MKGQYKIYGPIKKRGAKQKLTPAQKTQMRNDMVLDGMKIPDLAVKYNLCQSMVYAHLKATKPLSAS